MSASPLFCDVPLAERIEGGETRFMALCGEAARRRAGTEGFVLPLAGGTAIFAGPDAPFNKVAGLGFAGVPEEAALDEVERAYAARGAPVQVELAHLADPAVGALLTSRGYRLESFENVLGLALDGREPERAAPPGVEIRPSGDEELGPWLDLVADAFAHADTQGVPSHEDFPREALTDAMRDFAAAGVRRYAAVSDDTLAGGASLRVSEGIAQLAGAATAPAHRRRGIQSAFLTRRLSDARVEGCDLAVVTTQPGSKSQQNVQRQGFDLLYTRAILVKHP